MAVFNDCDCQYAGKCKFIRKLSAAIYEIADGYPDIPDVDFQVVQDRTPYFSVGDDGIELSCGFLKTNSFTRIARSIDEACEDMELEYCEYEQDEEEELEGDYGDGERAYGGGVQESRGNEGLGYDGRVREGRSHEDKLESIRKRLEKAAGREIKIEVSETIDGQRLQAISYNDGRTVGITRYLKENFTEDELAYVIGHEVEHHMQKEGNEYLDVEKTLRVGFHALGKSLDESNMGKLGKVVAGILGGGAVIGATYLASRADMRKHELEANAEGLEIAMKAGYDPKAAISAEKKLNAYVPEPGILESLTWTHPGPGEMIEKIESKVHEVGRRESREGMKKQGK